MTHLTFAHRPRFADRAPALARTGRTATVLGLALVFAWIGAMKFTVYEAQAIEGLVASSPLLSWLYGILDVREAAGLIGGIEITTAALLIARLRWPLIGAFGAILAAGTTAITLSFLFTAPGWEPTLGGFPALSVVPGQFLLKDAVLFGAALWVLGDALLEYERTA